METDLSRNALEQYVFFNGQRVARRDISTNAVHYYFSDQLGSHGVIENATATACEQDIDYYPYGGVENDYCPNVSQNYKFTGKERDTESDPSKDNWAGPGGMGPPGGRGDWAAAVHDYNFETNHIKIGSYFNPFLSPATSRALIKSNNTLMRNAGGIQSLKMGLFFGPVNALQWYANSWK